MAKRKRVKGKGASILLGDEPAPQQANKTAKQHNGKTVNTGKATFYLPEDLIDNLDDVWLTLRKRYKGKKVTKSEIAQIAIEEMLKDWEEKQGNSKLVNRLTSE